MHFRPLRLILSLAISLYIASCGGSATKTASVSGSASNQRTEQLNEAIMLGAAKTEVDPTEGYLIGPEDLLEIDAYNVEELKKTLRVNYQGNIALPLVGVLHVQGSTPAEVEQLIAKKLEKYVQETVVNVYVKEYRSQRISVIGAVTNPQIFSVTGQRYLIDMLMQAGGLSPEAGNICYVIRPSDKNNPNSPAETIVIDLDELLVKGNFPLNIPVFAGDVINVPKGGIFFVDGAVKKPGAYTLMGKTSLVQAISLAQGITPTAAQGDVRIFRDDGQGERKVIYADYDAISTGENPDILISENDIIIVPVSGIKSFFSGFINTLKGFVTFGVL